MDIKTINEFIKKVEESKKREKFDLSSDQDLSIAIMNLVSIEEHFFFTGAKTGKKKYYDLIDEARKIRKDLLKKLIKDYEGEVWCLSKHLLAASMRLYEVGTKELAAGKKKEAYDLFEKSFNLYSLFWGLALKQIDTSDIKQIDGQALSKEDSSKSGFMGKLKELVKKVVDCCIE